MNIGLIADNTKTFPSLPLMKIAAYYRAYGNSAELAVEGKHYDVVFVSRTFNLNLPTVKQIDLKNIKADRILMGGSGYAIEIVDGKEIYNQQQDSPLPDAIEHIYPYYDLYPELTKDTAYGFLTRGCPNNCPFCVVSSKEGRRTEQVADLSEFWKEQKNIKLMDANILACKEREELLKQLIESKAYIDYTQGLDARLIDSDVAKLISQTKIKMVHFAFDDIKNEKAIIRGLTEFNKVSKLRDREKRCYILVNYNSTFEEDLYRIKKVIELGFHPDVRIYQKENAPQFLKDLARWANNSFIYRSCDFLDYEPRKYDGSVRKMYPEVVKLWKGRE